MTKFLFPLLFSFLCSSFTNAQTSNTELNTIYSISENLKWKKNNKQNFEELYLFKKWENGTVYFNNNRAFSKESKYNYYLPSERMHILKNKDTLEIQSLYTIDSIIINNRKFIYTYFEEDENIKQGYFEEICSGNIKLLKRHQCFYTKTTRHFENSKESYEIKYKYYSQKEKRIAGRIKLKKKSIVNIFPSHKKKIEAYIKKNKIKNETNLVNLFNYYNSLQ